MKPEHAQGDLFVLNSLNIPLQPRIQLQKAIIVHWRKPQEGLYKLNTDGASKGIPDISGVGGILRDHLGRDKGFRSIWIETDAKAVIMLISSPRQRARNVQNTLQRIRKILSQKDYRISHIFREGNQAVDFLANRACTSQQLCILHEDGLTGKVKGIVILDSSGLPYIRFKTCQKPLGLRGILALVKVFVKMFLVDYLLDLVLKFLFLKWSCQHAQLWETMAPALSAILSYLCKTASTL
ncbi:UNVERIFIED_CONTAM: hypothetical protein Sradi_7160800 [Sesamum radiatum]|uniref:RNase H type-1 domain-containing protein n=1 Tax=Sesamum radiatum TaxID=300843 RepID=A0AAW2IUT1_SESRA